VSNSRDLVLLSDVITQARRHVTNPRSTIPHTGRSVTPVGCIYRLRNDLLTRLERGVAIIGCQFAFSYRDIT
jgi:hypothetical protein